MKGAVDVRVHAQNENDTHDTAERSGTPMTRNGVPDGTGMMSIGTTVGLLQEGIAEARALFLPRRKQRRKQRT
jgi:hypothetical protein